MPGSHFTYKTPADIAQLQQGDILNKTDEIKSLLEIVHPHYLKEDYLYFIVLTQTCDLWRRGAKPCKAPYITLAAVRPLDLLLEREIKQYQNQHALSKGKIIDKSFYVKLASFIEKLLNNNAPEYFYLHEDAGLGFSESCVAFLRLSIAIKAKEHYDKCLKAKVLELDDTFKAKLGWLVGNMYSRVGTEDWVPAVLPSTNAFNKKIKSILDQHCYWIDVPEFEAELKKRYSSDVIEAMSAEQLLQLANDIPLLSKEDKIITKLENTLQNKLGTVDSGTIQDIVFQLRNDPEIKAILK